MIPSKGNNKFKDNKFDFWTWSAPVLQTQEEVVAKIEELKLIGRTIADIQSVGLNYGFENDSIYDVFDALNRGDNKKLAKLKFPCTVIIDEPLLIKFSDGDVLGIDFSESSSIRMELNTLPWDIRYGINPRDFHANQMFRGIIGRTVGNVLITSSIMPEDMFTGSHGLSLAKQSSYLHSVSFCCVYNGQDHNINRSLKLAFETDFDYGCVCLLNDEDDIESLPGECIKDVIAGYWSPDKLKSYLGMQ